LVLIARVAVLDYIGHDMAYALGAGTSAVVFWGIVPAWVYWGLSQREKKSRKMIAARIVFWSSLAMPYVISAILNRNS
jgi:hypothetical protein